MEQDANGFLLARNVFLFTFGRPIMAKPVLFKKIPKFILVSILIVDVVFQMRGSTECVHYKTRHVRITYRWAAML